MLHNYSPCTTLVSAETGKYSACCKKGPMLPNLATGRMAYSLLVLSGCMLTEAEEND